MIDDDDDDDDDDLHHPYPLFFKLKTKCLQPEHFLSQTTWYPHFAKTAACPLPLLRRVGWEFGRILSRCTIFGRSAVEFNQ